MYKPLFNQVLVEIDDKDAAWGRGNNDNIGGEVFREGKLLDLGNMCFPFGDTSQLNVGAFEDIGNCLRDMIGKTVMFNEGHEAGKVFEHDGKRYALIYWWDLVGVKE